MTVAETKWQEGCMMFWQPIETAPRDGTDILVATQSYLGGVVMAAWDKGRRQEMAWMDMYGDAYPDATHWMPLPPPPKAAP